MYLVEYKHDKNVCEITYLQTNECTFLRNKQKF